MQVSTSPTEPKKITAKNDSIQTKERNKIPHTGDIISFDVCDNSANTLLCQTKVRVLKICVNLDSETVLATMQSSCQTVGVWKVAGSCVSVSEEGRGHGRDHPAQNRPCGRDD